ncbi:hypothetical protein [Azospirillum sp. TSO22-1]|uniref:hypothetical protein n=1 Tax=Azospirillum sp. TSO22-1 TaxID=716789 RepID=UPI000D61F46D|nr:hypothetical protein [Azospirillum sp. TSO22-1]PWC56233.1 hypothetical protein TSO221_02475 [Azospirillum sp. TSO22-1]
MRNLSRAVFDDAIEMTLRSDRLSDAQKAGLLARLREIRDGFCDKGAECDHCPARCACEELVRRAFAGEPDRLVG